MRIALLDTNVLIALAWPNHIHHGPAQAWFAKESSPGWATCAMTQLAFVRVSSNRPLTGSSITPSEAAALLQNWINHPAHRFFESPPAAEPSTYTTAFGHNQVNDAWLIHLAVLKEARFVTFDRRAQAHAKDPRTVLVIPS